MTRNSTRAPTAAARRVRAASVDRNRGARQEFRKGGPRGAAPVEGRDHDLGHGDVVIAAITSCTNTSNPNVMIGAGLLARKAMAKGLR